MVLQAQDPGQVVDAGRQGAHLGGRHAQVPGERVHGPVHRVAEADHGQADGLVHRPDEHPHRVRVVEQRGVGAGLVHVGGDPEHHRDRAQAPEHAADVDGVVDRVPQAVAGGDVEVDLGGPGAADLDRVDHVVGVGQGGQAVELRADRGLGAQGRGGPGRHPLRGPQPVRVDVVEHQLRVAQRRERQDVAQQVARELDAARADEDDPGHDDASPPPTRMWVSPWL